MALTHGALRGKEGVLARIHDQRLTSVVFGSKRCDCKEQLGMALDRVRLFLCGLFCGVGGAECGLVGWLVGWLAVVRCGSTRACLLTIIIIDPYSHLKKKQ